MKLKSIASEDVVNLLSLIGIEGKVVSNKEEVIDALREAMLEKSVVLITYSWSKQITSEILRLNKERPDFIILEIPDPGGEMPTLEETQKLLEEAVGIKLR